jgi:hypothetical protein
MSILVQALFPSRQTKLHLLARRLRSCLTVVSGAALLLAAMPGPGFTQAVPGTVKGGVKGAQDGAKALGEISKVLAKIKDDSGALKFAQLAKITETIGDVAPFIAILTVAFDLAGLGAEKPETKLLMGINNLDAKLTALNTRMSALFDIAAKRVTVAVRWSDIDAAVGDIATKEQEINTFLSMTSQLDYPEYEKDALNTVLLGAATKLAGLCKAADYQVIGSSTPLRTDVIESVAQGSFGNLDDIAAMGIYLSNNILRAKSAYSQLFFIAEYGRLQKGESDFGSTEVIAAKGLQHTMPFDALADACTRRTAEVMLKYGQTSEQHTQAEKFIESTGSWSKSPKEIVDLLAGEYKYLDWYALKYKPVFGFSNHVLSYSKGTYFRPRTESMKYNLVVSFSHKAKNYRPDLWDAGCGAIVRDLKFSAELLNVEDVENNRKPRYRAQFVSGSRSDLAEEVVGQEGLLDASGLDKADNFIAHECGDERQNVDALWMGDNDTIGPVEFYQSNAAMTKAQKGAVFVKGPEYSHFVVLRESDLYLDYDDFIKRKSQYFVQNVATGFYLGASQDEDVLISSNAPTWMFVPADDGYFYLRSTVTGKYAGVDHPAFTTLIGAFYVPDFKVYAASHGEEKAHHFQWHFDRQPGPDPVFKISNRARPGQYLSNQQPYPTLSPAMGDVSNTFTNWKLSY